MAPHYIDVRIVDTTSEDVRILAVAGTIDMLSAAQVLTSIVAANEPDIDHVVVDLTKVDFLASAGMTMLLDAQEALDSTGFSVVANDSVLRPMRLVGVDGRLSLYESVDLALTDRRRASPGV